MIREDLERKAAELGFRSADPGPRSDANRTIAEVVKSRDQRYWEAFPVMLAAAAEAGEFNYEAAAAYLGESGQNQLKLLVFASLGLYESLGVRFKWTKRLFGDFPARLVNHYKEKLNAGSELVIGDIALLPENIRENFLKRSKQAAWAAKRPIDAGEQLDLELAVSRIFTPRQKELFLKKLRRKKMTKTEKEYFSRVIKKKTQALANEDLHRLARKALE
ncbi:MAG: hypothetical protein Q8O90_03650 [Elusimicrobiota bacterium]|nr:hypothetical protein [Elusimicrobiota bacterium]